MRFFEVASSSLLLANFAYCQTQAYCDSVTSICSTSYTTKEGIDYRIAIPQVDKAPFDVILQIVAPVATGWAGLAWGGGMTNNPLTVAWANGQDVVVSSRSASSRRLPGPYAGAEYTILKGTGVNATHWTLTARCSGCSAWDMGGAKSINAAGTSKLAYAFSSSPVVDPASNSSAFQKHDATGSWTHDFKGAQNSKFESWVSGNLAASPDSPPTVTSSSAPSSTPAAPSSTPSLNATGGASSSSACPGVAPATNAIQPADGWKAVKVSGNLTTPRGVILDTQGRLLVVEDGKGITQLTMAPDGCIQSSKTLIQQDDLNHGIYLSPDGKTLYASSMSTVWSWDYDSAGGNVQGTPKVLVTGMNQSGHVTRTLIVPPHRPDLLVVSHGSDGNIDGPSIDPATARAIVKVFDLKAVPASGYNYAKEGWNMGYGLRNEVALAFDGNNMLWGVENSGDNIARTISNKKTDVHIDNPAEELNYLGDVTKPNDQWYGYPTCFTVWEPSVITDKKYSVGEQFVQAPNATFNDDNCAKESVPPRLSFQAHSAPIDAKFDADSKNLYITLHGSWNREPPTGYKLVVVPFAEGSDGTFAPVAAANSRDGYQDVFSHQDVSKCAAFGAEVGCARPAGLTFDSKGRLYMTSDASVGEMFMLQRA